MTEDDRDENDITDSMDMGLGGLRELVTDRVMLSCCGSWGRIELDLAE